jgi:hypothetical protein
MHSKQRAIIEFLLAENKLSESIANIHRHLTYVYGDMAMDKSTVSEAISIIRTRKGQSA